MKRNESGKKLWDQLASHMNDREKAFNLLYEIYLEIGPYRDSKLKDATWQKVCSYFEFDDSE